MTLTTHEREVDSRVCGLNEFVEFTCEEARELDHWLAECDSMSAAIEEGSLEQTDAGEIVVVEESIWIKIAVGVVGVLVGGLSVSLVK